MTEDRVQDEQADNNGQPKVFSAVDLMRHVAVNDAQPFTLHSGQPSHVRFDVMREPASCDHIVDCMVRAVYEAIRPFPGNMRASPALMVGIPTGGAVLAALVLDELREQQKESPFDYTKLLITSSHAEASDYAAELELGKASPDYTPLVIVIDDVITTGGTVDDVVSGIRTVTDSVVVICALDRRLLRDE